MKEVDARGLSCPMPLMLTKKALEDAPEEILVHSDSGTSKQNVVGMLNDYGYDVTVEQTGEEYRIRGTRT